MKKNCLTVEVIQGQGLNLADIQAAVDQYDQEGEAITLYVDPEMFERLKTEEQFADIRSRVSEWVS